MKKVIVFRVENVLVKDFNKAESLERAVAIETNKLKRNVGLDVLEKELKKKGKNDEERELVKKECKKRWEEIRDKLSMKIKENGEWVERVLWNNGLREMEVENCSGCWVERIIENSGKDRGDVVLFSNDMGDLESSELWGIKVERLNVEIEGIGGFMGKIGLKQCA